LAPARRRCGEEFQVSLGGMDLNFKFLRGDDGKVFGLRVGFRVLMKQ
jgi:hypothetical protein